MFFQFFFTYKSAGSLADFIQQRLQQFAFWHGTDFFTMLEKDSATIASRYSHVRVTRLAWSVYLTSHDGYFLQVDDKPLRLKAFHFMFNGFRHRYEIDFRPPASRT